MRTPWTRQPASGGKQGKPAIGGKGPADSSSDGMTAFGGKEGKPVIGGRGPAGSSSDGMPASGGNEGNTFLMRDDSGAGHWLREATVTGLPELFASFGHLATAKELYEWWGQARVIVHKRLHGGTAPARREAARRRYDTTGCWGWGPAGHWQQ